MRVLRRGGFTVWEDTKFFHDAATDTQGFGMYGKECIVICFRGTESFRDWSLNAKATNVWKISAHSLVFSILQPSVLVI
jgi:hypothetical protein